MDKWLGARWKQAWHAKDCLWITAKQLSGVVHNFQKDLSLSKVIGAYPFFIHSLPLELLFKNVQLVVKFRIS